jgi:peptide/nickel transport system substrate-binding protein
MTHSKGSPDGVDRRSVLRLTGTVAAGATLGSWLLPGSTLAAKPKVGGTLVHLVQPEVPTLATFLSTSIPVSQAGTRAYAGLLEYNFDLSLRPSLAESWTVTDQGRTVTFKLRPGVKFHDGKPLTSADVQFSIMEVLKKFHPRAPNSFKEVEKIETPDPQTAVFRLNKPAPYMMMVLSGFETPIVPKHLFEGTDIKNSKYANEPVGAGPFKFVEWKRGQYIRFDRFGDYFKKDQPYLERVVVRSIADTATRSAVLEKGEVHLAGFGAVPYSDVIQLAKLPHITVTKKGYESSSPIVQIDFNTRKAPFDNKKVRQAIAYALERKYIIDKIWFGFGRVATGPINSNFKASGLYTSDVKNYEVANGLEMANRLLDEAGFKRNASGVRFEVTHDVTPYGEEWQRFGEYVKQRLDQLGIKVTLRYEDVATWLRRVYTEYDFQFTSNWLQTFPDPVIGVHRMHHSTSIRKGTVFVNNTGWSSPKTDELMDKAAIEPDAAKRAQLYKEFQQIVVEECAITYIHELEFPTIYNNKYVEIIDSALGVLGNFDQAHVKS